MKKLFAISFSILWFNLLTINAQTVIYDGGIPNRPIAINGYTFNGVTYNITITYNTSIDGTVTSGFSQSEASMISANLRDILNTQIPNSDPTQFYIVTGDSGNFFNGCNINFTDGGPWARSCSVNLAVDQSPNSDRGITSFQIAPPDNPIPTLSQWGIITLFMIMLIVGVVSMRHRKVLFR